MPIPFLNSINLTKNQVENFCIYNLGSDPTGSLTAAGDLGYFWLNTAGQKTLKWWDGTNIRSIIDSTNIGSFTSGLATDLAGGAGGDLPYQAGTNDTTFLPLGTAGQVLAVKSTLTQPEWINQSSITAGAVANALTAGTYLTSGGTYNGSAARTFAVDATDANTASKVVARDGSGNFSAGTITANLTGTASSATNKTGGNLGDILVQSGSGTTSFLNAGTAGQVITSNGASPQYVNQSTLSVGSATTAGSVTNALTAGSYLTSTGTFDGSVARTFAVDATDANTASKVVARDASGNFAAGTITATRVTGLSAPSAGSDAANRDYVDSVAQGLDVKASCKAATVSNINLASPGATIDTVSLSVDNRVLVKDQSAPAENGIYLWKGAAVAMVRSPDADTWDDLVGAFTFVEEGTTANADSGWVCSVNAGGTLGSTAVTWVKFSQAGSYTQGRGMVLDGTAFNFAQNTDYAVGDLPYATGQTTIGLLPAVATGNALISGGVTTAPSWGKIGLTTHVSGTLPIANGGTGATSFTQGQVLFAGASTISSSANLFWDNANNFLGINTSTPIANLDVRASNGVGAVFLRTTDPAAAVASAYIQTPVSTGHSATSVYGFWYQNTGVANPSAETLAINTNATERLRIASDGVCTWSNVGGGSGTAMTLNGTGLGVGTDPTGFGRLVVRGTAAGAGYLGVDTDATRVDIQSYNKPLAINRSGNNVLFCEGGGNVGIGTATPNRKLEIAAGTGGAALRLTNTNGGSGIEILTASNKRSWLIGAQNNVDEALEITPSTAAGGTTFTNPVYSVNNTGLHYWYDGAGGTRMTLNATGLGVGVSPDTNLHVRKDFAGYTTIKVQNNSSLAAGTGASFTLNDGGVDASWFRRQRDGSGNTDIGYKDTLRFRGAITATERTDMVIDTSGNVGIGTASPGARLDINAGTNLNLAVGGLTLDNFTNDGVGITFSRTTDDGDLMALGVCDTNKLGLFSREGLIFATGGAALYGQTSEKMRLDGSGNLGLGVTPKTWGSSYKAIQVNTTGAVTSYSGAVILGNNYYANSSGNPAYITAAAAGAYAIVGKTHTWYRSTDATPVADGACTLDPAMVLDASGNLGIGTPTINERLEVFGYGKFSSGWKIDTQGIAYGDTGNSLVIGADPGNASANSSIQLMVDGSERLRIKSTGQVNFVGLASDPAGAAGDVYYNSTAKALKLYATDWKTLPRKAVVQGGAGTGTTIAVAHNLNTNNVSVTVLRTTDNVVVFTDVAITDADTVTITFASAVTKADYTITVIG